MKKVIAFLINNMKKVLKKEKKKKLSGIKL
jgi:hypothetical protein